MNKLIHAFIIVIVIIIICSFFLIKVNNLYYWTVFKDIIQIVALILMFFTVFLGVQQIAEMRKIEKQKIVIAITSLIEEINYNKKLINDYIQHSEVGCNVTPKEGRISWEWNKPRLGAYERYGILACGNNVVVFQKLTFLYEKLESCKVIIEEVHQIVANNLIEIRREGGREYFQTEIGRLNKQLYEISKEVNNLVDSLLRRLETMRLAQCGMEEGIKMNKKHWFKKCPLFIKKPLYYLLILFTTFLFLYFLIPIFSRFRLYVSYRDSLIKLGELAHISVKKENRLQFKIGHSDSAYGVKDDNYEINFTKDIYERIWFQVANYDLEDKYKNVKIYLEFDASIKPVEIKITNPGEFWSEFKVGCYNSLVGMDIGPREVKQIYSLDFIFKEKGRYPFICTITADGYKPISYKKHLIVK